MASLEYEATSTTRNADADVPAFPAAYDEKDDMDSLKEKLARRKKPIYAGLAFLCVVVIGVSVGVSTGSSTSASTESAMSPSSGSGSDATSDSTKSSPSGNGAVEAADDGVTAVKKAVSGSSSGSAGSAGWSSSSASTDSSVAGEAGSASWSFSTSNSTSASSSASASASASAGADATTAPVSTEAPASAESDSEDGETLAYSLVDFDWTDASNWEYASGSSVSSDMVTSSGITLTPENSAEPIRTLQGWSGEKVVYISWERSDSSDTNIWMLNTKLEDQFASGNGWPYWGELDLFEMFTQDAADSPSYDYSGFGGFSDVSSYGQLTMHMGPPTEDGSPCYCPASASKTKWYDDAEPMTSGCTAQFSNDASNSLAAVWGSDSNGQYIQLLQNPSVTKGGKLNGAVTYDVAAGSGAATPKIYNNADTFWGVDASAACASTGGHDATSGFPFFESFRIILEEQKKDDASAYFTVTNIQIFSKN